MLEYNDRLLYVTGFWMITFLLGGVVFIILPFALPGWLKSDHWDSGPLIVLYPIFLVITSTAFCFYIHYLGKSPLTLYIAFKVILVCLLPLLVLVILYKYNSMKQAMSVLQDQIHYYISQSGAAENEGDQILDINSDSKTDNLKLRFRDIILIKSADNYFEVFYTENGLVERKLIRGTLKNIESQLANRSEFLKCHRTCIANLNFMESMVRSYSGYGIKLQGLEETVPVSRQHLMKVKNALSSRD